ncbi:hypothetical protein [Amycolatopsis regifaucium]|uniref:Glycogen operon protein GlgX n=1 Tax=Amycolatopsis regifaucium TaxID=546365 RepID=A0A154M778_9PSEU|nr:hypothetical protein [Amycolatopsis regifaucium]KZB79709.1 glycogen operon protein GlgX [Amycolatopsis regifaucium]OKA09976.1 glycogen operon protein GlgX [Amycolatopsis regifaucium]SFI66570.1 hypothetical protein SAMN04489731_112101 [Amycolatopsis regifaucium]
MTLDQQVQPTESTSRDATAENFDAYYGKLFGWSVKWLGSRPFLALENGICAATLPKLSAGPVLDRLAVTGCDGPAFVVPSRQGRRVAILAETDGLIPPRSALPRDVEVLAGGALLPLPMGNRRVDSSPEWVTAPDPRQRWLPSLSAVLAGIHACR